VQAGELLVRLLRAGDASVLVEAETAKALGATRFEGAWQALSDASDRNSWNETIRVGVLDGFAALQDPRAIEVAAQWLAPRFATLLRCAAIRCLCAMVAEPVRVLQVLQPYAADTSFRFAFNLAASLGQLGDGRAIALLQTVAERAVDGRVKKRAAESIAALRAGLSAGQQVQGLRSDLDTVRNQVRDLSDTVQRSAQLRRGDPG
jgi:aminopeptidase N